MVSATIESSSIGLPETAVGGYLYYSSSQYVTVPVNLISVFVSPSSENIYKYFSIGDKLIIRIKAIIVAGPTPVKLVTVKNKPLLLQSIFSGLSL